jgi:hypothetical protein
MFVTEQYNDLPQKILDRIPKLTGQMVKFVVRGKYWDKSNKTWRFPYMTAIPKTDRIVDPETNAVYTIANIHNVSTSGEPVMPMIYFDSSGHILIRPDENGRYSSSDILTYEFLMLCNYNGTNPNRDGNTKVWFEQVNDEKVAKSKVDEKAFAAEAIKIVAQLQDEEVPLMAAQVGVGEVSDQTQALRLKLIEYAEKEPQKIQDAFGVISNLGDYVSDIEKAIEHKLITADRRNNAYKWADTKQEIYQAQRGLAANVANASFARWLKTTQEGAAAYATLKKVLQS